VSAIDFRRTFSMGAFEALRLVRIKQADYPGRAYIELVDIIRTIEADGAAHDFDAAFGLDAIVDKSAPALDAFEFYRECIAASIFDHRPLWVKTIPLGRRKFVQKLETDAQQCFSAAGLLDDPPSEQTITWWDRVSAQTRLMGDEVKMTQAREGERLSLAYESTRLARLGLDKVPIWMSIEDNTVGYDILSYDVGTDGPITRVLEVKSTIASPLRFYVTRNEWEMCQKMSSAYHFHIWDMKTGNLFERTAADIANHVPKDQGGGRWANVEIRIGASS